MTHVTMPAEMRRILSATTTENALHIIAAMIFGHFMVALDNIPLPLLLQKGWYYRDFALTTFFAWIILKHVSLSTDMLDRRWGWADSIGKRMAGQLILGVGGAALAAYLISYLQYRFLDPEHVFGTKSFLSVEFPVIVILALCINFVYAALSFKSNTHRANDEEDSAPEDSVRRNACLLVESGHSKIPLAIEKIAYFKIHAALTWVCTFDNELYRIDKSLGELMPELPSDQFFRVNRQTIVHIAACYSYKSEEFGKISIGLIKPLSLEIPVSQKTAPAFRKWIVRNA